MFCSRTEMFRGIASSTNPSVSFCHRMTFSFSICSRMIGFHAFMLTLLNMLMSFECVFSFDDVRSPGPSGPRVVIDKSFCQRVWGPNRFSLRGLNVLTLPLGPVQATPRGWRMERPRRQAPAHVPLYGCSCSSTLWFQGGLRKFWNIPGLPSSNVSWELLHRVRARFVVPLVR